jgi:hypothetical protein
VFGPSASTRRLISSPNWPLSLMTRSTLAGRSSKARIAEYGVEISQYRRTSRREQTRQSPARGSPEPRPKVTAHAEAHAATGRSQMTRDEIADIVTALGDHVQIVAMPTSQTS